MKRTTFLLGAASGIAATGAAATAATQDGRRMGRKALVLVGGVNRGAYQAGAICAMARNAGLRDGEPLDYDLVCGTSIGALNSYFVATAQYSLLRRLWVEEIASRHIFRLKREYASVPNDNSGVLTRLGQALALGNGMTKNVTGVLDPSPVAQMIDHFFDASKPVHIPSYIATTNLSRQDGQIFNRRPTTETGMAKQSIDDLLLKDFPVKAVTATDDIAHSVYFATACLPLAFDPIVIDDDQYVDGGVTANAPVNLAQLCAQTLHVILVDPKRPLPDVHYRNAVEVALGVFQTMQSRILMYQLIAAYAAAYANLPFQPFVMRPAEPLPGRLGDFNDGVANAGMFDIGFADGTKGWEPFTFPLRGLLTPFDRG